jgi:hypothetical protein
MACAPQIDVVAFQTGDAAEDQDSGSMADTAAESAESGADSSPPPPPCEPTAASSIYLAEPSFVIDRFSPKTGATVSLGMPDCAKTMLSYILSIAVSADGTLWVADASGVVIVVDPLTSPPKCTAQPFKLMPSMGPTEVAFLPPPGSAPPPLYIAENDSLLVIDPRSLVQAPIGMLPGTGLLGLGGTVDGRLYAVRSGMSQNQAAISLLNPADASVLSTVTTVLAGMQSLSGGAYWGGAFYLFAPPSVFVLTLGTGELSGPEGIPVMSSVVVAATAPCAPPP